MPYVLSKVIRKDSEALWKEGPPYTSEKVYDLCSNDLSKPQVNYSSHTIRPHSLPHVDAPAHILKDGLTIDKYFSEGRLASFFGRTVCTRLKGENWKSELGLSVWRVSKQELIDAVERASGSRNPPDRLFLTAEKIPQTEYGDDERFVLVLDESAAEWLLTNSKFCAYGTSWKSTDFQPGSRERPIHRILFRQALIFECLDLELVPEGEYFLSSFPLPLQGASESPVCPVLFRYDEIF